MSKQDNILVPFFTTSADRASSCQHNHTPETIIPSLKATRLIQARKFLPIQVAASIEALKQSFGAHRNAEGVDAL